MEDGIRLIRLAAAALACVFLFACASKNSSGEIEPTPLATEEPTPYAVTTVIAWEPTATPEPTEKPTATPEPTEEPTTTPEPTEEPTATPEPTGEPTATPEPTRDPYAPKGLDTLPETFPERVLAIARNEIGYTENRYDSIEYEGEIRCSTRFGAWYGRPYNKWCSMFTSYCVYYAGMTDYPFDYSCIRHECKLKAAGYWRDWNSYIPQPGDIVFFRSASKIYSAHSAIVESVLPADGVEPARLVTIDGNIIVDDASNQKGVDRMERTFQRVIGCGTYTKGEVYPEVESFRNEDIPAECTPMSAPDWDVLTFIGADRTPYARRCFPEKFQKNPQ